MTDEQLDQLMKRANAGDDDALADIDAWIEQALGPLCVTAPIDSEVPRPYAASSEESVCCGSCSAGFAY